jgi:PleD family two-component response regulator
MKTDSSYLCVGASPSRPVAKPRSSVRRKTVKKLNVLIVDDSSVMRKIVERSLRQAGLDIAEVLEG